MFEGVNSAFKKFFSKERVVALVLFLILMWALYTYSGSKTMVFDRMDTGSAQAPVQVQAPAVAPAQAPVAPVAGGNKYSTQQVANPSDLLPQDQNSQWSALNPTSMNKGDVLMPDLLQAGYHIGLDTIGQTLRNANLQLRSDPIISKSDIGPWNQSTIEPDYGRVPLELGQGNK
jgi:hypothetical protein